MKKSWRKKTKKAKAKKIQNRELSRNDKEALVGLSQKGEKMWAKMNKRDVNGAIAFGQILIEAKKVVSGEAEGKKAVWGRYRKKLFPYLEAKTAQRYMQLAEHVDLKEHPTLAHLGQAKLLRLIQLGDGKTPVEVLFAGDMDIEFDPKDADARKQFQSETADLISKLNVERRESKAEESPKEPGRESVQTLIKLRKLLSQPEELAAFGELLEGDEEFQADNKWVRVQLRKLAPAIMKRAGKSSGNKKVKIKKVGAKR
jgi:hypothetical protein